MSSARLFNSKKKKGHDKDKYYHLAKDQGYRSRAAFKLIQINRRFGFLHKANVCLDLCAAPGGWAQVAAKEMPKNSIIIGVDLLPIRAIHGVKTLVHDITTAECRRAVAAELQGWKCDVVLCDGAPNIGSNYQKDAFVQNELVLAALKTATDHLGKGGTFCSKIYRSVDYESLIWVFRQMFEDVQAIKPNSSRSQSSEIFVVCLKYIKPDKIDPKLLDPNHVFKSVDNEGHKKVDVMHKKYEKMNKRHRSGYDMVSEGGALLTRESSVSNFVNSNEPIRVLTDINELHFNTDECLRYKEMKFTTLEIQECFKDLRVLGKTDYKKLLKWRQRVKTLKAEEDKEAMGSDDEDAIGKDHLKGRKKKTEEKEETEESILDQIMQDREEAFARERRAKKKARLQASKDRQRQALGMMESAFDIVEDQDLFAKERANLSDSDLGAYMSEGSGDDSDDSDIDRGGLIHQKGELFDELDADYIKFNQASEARQKKLIRAAKNKSKRDNKDYSAYAFGDGSGEEDGSDNEKESGDTDDEDDAGFDSDHYSDDDTEEGEEEEGDEEDGDESDEDEDATEQWFSNPIFKETYADGTTTTTAASKDGKRKSQSEIDVQGIIDNMPKTDKQKRAEKRKKEAERRERRENKRNVNMDDDDDMIFDERHIVRNKKGHGADGEEDNAYSGVDQGDGDDKFEIVANKEESDESDSDDLSSSDSDGYDSDERARILAVGTMALQPKKKKRMIEASYNRYSWQDPDGLPTWFVDDESKNYKRGFHVPQPLMDSIKGRNKVTGGKDIKKAVEAKARKKKRAVAKLKLARKNATAVAANPEMSDRQKLKAISKAMKEGKSKQNNSKVYAVSRRSKGGSMATKGSGNGKVKFVDKRMRADNHMQKKREKKKKNGSSKKRR